jgi:hypothetical protein
MRIRESVNLEINCPKSKSKAAMRALDDHWYGWIYEWLEPEEVLSFVDVEANAVEILKDYEDVLVNGRMGWKGLNEYRDGIHFEFYEKYIKEEA